jgi:uncharacterized protein YhhL (DUF1145 family)
MFFFLLALLLAKSKEKKKSLTYGAWKQTKILVFGTFFVTSCSSQSPCAVALPVLIF